jgi:hypothetical protein
MLPHPVPCIWGFSIHPTTGPTMRWSMLFRQRPLGSGGNGLGRLIALAR